MSPVNQQMMILYCCVPRASGDEPGHLKTGNLLVRCSPRERG